MQRIEHVVLKQLLVADPHFDGLTGGAVLPVPRFDQGDVEGASGPSRSGVKGTRGPQQRDAVGCVVRVEWAALEEWTELVGQLKVFVVLRQKVRLRKKFYKYTYIIDRFLIPH